MAHNHHQVYCAVYAIFVKDRKILLLKRKNTGWRDGYYGLPQGHLEKGESIKDALLREIREEVGLTIDPTDITFYHVMHRNEKSENSYEYLDFYFKVEYWQGEPQNNEPEKAEGIAWYDLDRLPSNIIPGVKAAIEYFKNKIIFSELS